MMELVYNKNNAVPLLQLYWACQRKRGRAWWTVPRGGGDLVVQGDVPVAKFRVSISAIYYFLGSKISKFCTTYGCEN